LTHHRDSFGNGREDVRSKGVDEELLFGEDEEEDHETVVGPKIAHEEPKGGSALGKG
jgi:hypothetical protein